MGRLDPICIQGLRGLLLCRIKKGVYSISGNLTIPIRALRATFLATLINQGESLKLKIRNDELEVVQKTKYLGVQIDNKLDWKEHIKTVSSKVSGAIGFLKHAKSFLSESQKRL